MTVYELIQNLETMDPDALVMVTDDSSSGHYLVQPSISKGHCRPETYGRLFCRSDKGKKSTPCVIIE